MLPNFLGYIYSAIRKIFNKFRNMCCILFKMNPNPNDREKIWDPCSEIFSNEKTLNYAVVVLNTNFNFPTKILLNLWNAARIRHTVDGGTERWLSWLKSNNLDSEDIAFPDLITGDMDSLSKDVLHYFLQSKVSKVVCTPDQDETDFTKALRQLGNMCLLENIKLDSVYVIADTCGRLDQIIGNINTLYKSVDILKDVKVFQLASNSLTWILPMGKHTICIPLELRKKHEWCALVPLKSPTYVSSTGLKWNLVQSKLEFGGLVSTSNTYDEELDKVTICNEVSVVWIMGIEALLDK